MPLYKSIACLYIECSVHFSILKTLQLAWEKVQTKSEQRYEPASTQAIIEQTKVIQPGKEHGRRSLTESRR